MTKRPISVSNETLAKIKDFYPSMKMCQWFLDKMDEKNWLINKERFLKKIKAKSLTDLNKMGWIHILNLLPKSTAQMKSKSIITIS